MSEPLKPRDPVPADDQSPADQSEAAEEVAFRRWVERTAGQLADDLCPPQEVELMLAEVKSRIAARATELSDAPQEPSPEQETDS
ncbi:hypothetical protein [Streptomyces sp. NPDC050988]|uniref:hypothetical protein n=1 Tax=Streptomyces sp. NPDC050988 TaxID=3365637 RepID=UPI0037A15C92